MRYLTSWFQDFNYMMYSDRFSFFDVLVMMIFVGMANTYSLWWLLGIIPFSIIGAALSVRYNKPKEQ
jgi:hypothetical protein